MRFSELDGARVGVWGAGREIASFAGQLARRLPSARIAAAAFDEAPSEDVRDTLNAPDARILTVEADGGEEVVAALAACDVVVRSPGVSIYRPEMRALRESSTPVTTATALWLAEHGGERVIGITGTKGKSTTAALACHLARAAGRTAALAGNIGVPALDLLDADATDVTVLELSSYHIADLETGPEVALVTNLFREHTAWHGSEQSYRNDKLRLLSLPGVRRAVVNAQDPGLAAALTSTSTAALATTSIAPVADSGPRGDRHAVGDHFDCAVEMVTYGVPHAWNTTNGAIELKGKPMAASDELPLRGEHNALNLCGALTALEALGIEPPPLPGSLHDFRPLAHRLETVAERDGVLWVNDSISTTPESTVAALASFPGREVVLIAGGQDRGQDYTQLGRMLGQGGATVIGVPSTGARVIAAAREAGAPAERAILAGDLGEAVALARRLARAGGVILLSPAAPSFDNYRDFEERGECFRGLADARSQSG